MVACFPFRDQLLRDARTAQLLEDFRRENRASLDGTTRAIDAIRLETLGIFEELVVARPDVVPTEPEPHGYDRREPAIRRRLQECAPDPEDEEWNLAQEYEDYQHVGEAVRIVKHLLKDVDGELKTRMDLIDQRREFALRARRIYFQTSPGASLARVERDLTDLHPEAVDSNSHAALARLCRTDGKTINLVHSVIFHDGIVRSNQYAAQVDAWIDELRRDVTRIFEELRRRLGAERSLLALVERYRQKCQWYDAERLRALALGSSTPEDSLSETLATYLFDHGLNPLTRPLAGCIVPDILDANSRFSFYVEAKQYTKGCPAYLLQGMKQVWDMLDHLSRTSFDVREAFFVVYRRSGPRYSFPPRVQHRDRVVHVLVIDIAPTSERGSSAPVTRTFEVSELIPGAAIPHDPEETGS